VLDCFAGSGPLLDAAEQLQLKATLVEQAPHAHGIILERLARLENT
jgi:DNA modification methylase